MKSLTPLLLIVFMSSCETMCFKSIELTPSIEASKEGDADPSAKAGIGGVITWDTCQDAQTRRTLRLFEAEEKKAKKDLAAGKITKEHYNKVYSYYLAALERASQDAASVTGNIPKAGSGAGSSYESKPARAKALAADLLELSKELTPTAP